MLYLPFNALWIYIKLHVHVCLHTNKTRVWSYRSKFINFPCLAVLFHSVLSKFWRTISAWIIDADDMNMVMVLCMLIDGRFLKSLRREWRLLGITVDTETRQHLVLTKDDYYYDAVGAVGWLDYNFEDFLMDFSTG